MMEEVEYLVITLSIKKEAAFFGQKQIKTLIADTQMKVSRP